MSGVLLVEEFAAQVFYSSDLSERHGALPDDVPGRPVHYYAGIAAHTVAQVLLFLLGAFRVGRGCLCGQ